MTKNSLLVLTSNPRNFCQQNPFPIYSLTVKSIVGDEVDSDRRRKVSIDQEICETLEIVGPFRSQMLMMIGWAFPQKWATRVRLLP
jgi:hypothetical protein